MKKVTLRKPAGDAHIGRPHLDEDDETVMDGFKVTRTLRDRFSASCEQLDINKSDLLREFVEGWLARYEPKTEKYQKRLAEKRKVKK